MKKMKYLSLGTAISALLFVFSSCSKKIEGEGPVVTETRTASAFEGLAASVDATVYFTQSADQSIDDGEANEEKLTISGSGHVDISEMQVKDSEANISGSGSMKIFVTNNLKARISGSGTVYYRGNPAISTQISGSGAVVRM